MPAGPRITDDPGLATAFTRTPRPPMHRGAMTDNHHTPTPPDSDPPLSPRRGSRLIRGLLVGVLVAFFAAVVLAVLQVFVD